VRPVDKVQRPGRDLLIDGLHALFGQGTGVLDVAIGRGPDDAARAECLPELGVLGVIRIFRLLLRVEVVEVAEELVEAVGGRQVLIAVAQVVLAVLGRHVALRLEQRGDGRVLRPEPLLHAGEPHLEQARADRRLPGDKGGAAGGAALLPIPVGEPRALAGEAVDVRGFIAHHTQVEGAGVIPADIIAPDNEDVGLPSLWLGALGGYRPPGYEDGPQQYHQDYSPTRSQSIAWHRTPPLHAELFRWL
jgi:hypothetical protein